MLCKAKFPIASFLNGSVYCYKTFILWINSVLFNFFIRQRILKKYHRCQKILHSTTVSDIDTKSEYENDF